MAGVNKKKVKTKVSLVERRRFIRHPLVFPLKYRVLDNNEKGVKECCSRTVNISQGGLMFVSKEPANVNDKIMLQMPVEKKVFNVQAKVTHCSRDVETQLYEIGVCFFRLHDAFKTKLIEQIYLILEYRDLRSLELGKKISVQDASREWIKRYSERFKRLYW